MPATFSEDVVKFFPDASRFSACSNAERRFCRRAMVRSTMVCDEMRMGFAYRPTMPVRLMSVSRAWSAAVTTRAAAS